MAILGQGTIPARTALPRDFLYVIEDHEPDGVNINPWRLGMVAHLVHSTLRDEPDLEAACPHFVLLLESVRRMDEPGPFS